MVFYEKIRWEENFRAIKQIETETSKKLFDVKKSPPNSGTVYQKPNIS